LIEVIDSGIHWAEPRDWPFEWALQGLDPKHSAGGISSGHQDGAHIATCDARVHGLTNSLSTSDLKALLTPNGGEDIELSGY